MAAKPLVVGYGSQIGLIGAEAMPFKPEWILAIVAAVMLALVLRDVVRERRITPAAKARLLVALIFAAVLVWLSLQQK
jgi:branched-subunit amino acid transport protein